MDSLSPNRLHRPRPTGDLAARAFVFCVEAIATSRLQFRQTRGNTMSRLRLTAGRLAGLAHVGIVLFIAACASGGSSFLPPSRPAEFSLAGVSWGIPADSVTALIEPRGYNFNRVDEDGDMWFDGMLFRSPTRIYAFMSDDKLVKFRVFISTPDEAAVAAYHEARAELVKQFGPPKATVEQYQAPYRKGDERQLEAIRSGKATLETYWLPGANARMSHVSVSVTDELVVVVDYEGPTWERESLRRRKAR
jgi:hypothetical protein